MENEINKQSKKVLVTLQPNQAKELQERADKECRTLSNMVQYLLMDKLHESARQNS